MNNNKKFRAYFLNNNFEEFLRGNHLIEMMDYVENKYKGSRPYIGFIEVNVNGLNYLIPLTHNKSNSYKENHKYSILIPDENGNKIGILKINKMIPIIRDKNFITEININDYNSQFLINLIKEIDYLNHPKIYNQVYQLANEIHSKRYHASKEELETNLDLKFAVDFKKAEVLMYKYAFELYARGQLDEEPLFPEYLVYEAGILNEFSELKEYCSIKGIKEEDRFIIHDSQVCEIELLRHNDGSLELVEEIWDGTEEDEEGNTLYVRPFINTLNGICKTWTYEEIRSLTKQELMDDIKNNLGWLNDDVFDEKDELEDFYESLSDKLDKWNVFSEKNKDFENNQGGQKN